MLDKLNGTFLVLALVISNFTGEIFNKRLVKHIEDNYIIRLIILYVLIFMTIMYDKDGINYIKHTIRTTIIFIIFYMALKSKMEILLFIITLSIINRLVNHHIEYIEDSKQVKNKEYKTLVNISQIITNIIIIITILGFIYTIIEKKNNNKNFSIFKYLTERS